MHVQLLLFMYVTDLIELKVHYHAILHLMPENYELTINSLLDYINDDQVGAILCSSSSAIANKKILDCLIERVHCKENLFELCDQLESIITSHDMKTVINEIRLG